MTAERMSPDSRTGGPLCYSESVRNRSRAECTDLPWCIIFLLFLIFLIVTGVVAVLFGSPFRLLYGQDSFGNICGVKNDPIQDREMTGQDMTDRPFVFSYDITKPRDSLKMCVSRCPHRRLSTLKELETFAAREKSRLCRYDLAVADYVNSDAANVTRAQCEFLRSDGSSVEVLKDYGDEGCLIKILQWAEGYGSCPKLPVNPTVQILNRCVPNKADASAAVVYDFYAYLNSFDFYSRVMADLYASYREITGVCVSAFLVSVMILLVMHFIPAAAIPVIVAVVLLSGSAATGLLWWAWATLKSSLDYRMYSAQYDVLREETKNEIVLLVFAIAATLFTIVIFLLLLLVRRNTSHVVRMFQEGSRCIRQIPFLLLQPLWTFLCLGLFFVSWACVMLCLATSDFPRFVRKEIQFSNGNATFGIPYTTVTLIEYDDHTFLRLLWLCYAVALVWVSEFILACQHMVVAGAVSMWYFEKDKKECHGPVMAATKQLIFHHLGSVALGSILITIFKVPRLIRQYSKKVLKLKRTNGCLRVTRFLNHITHNAYAIVAVQGTNFIPAAKEAYSLLAENSLNEMLGVNSLGDFVIFLGKCAVTGVAAVIGFLSMKYDPQLHLYAIPLLLCCIFAYFIAHSVLSLYEVVIDTLFLCYCEDLRIHEFCSEASDTVDSANHQRFKQAYFASASLQEFMRTRIKRSNDVELHEDADEPLATQ
ncbi:CTL-like protein 1 [Hypsibius exemplaris]|uniref:Choline transporter-like protein n=1 Tax=Hypsibius exemplaris TaxID=2072580 RepID=A0A9X6NQ65_HYPEX|nr:CTL-like protein 1 [Hypsibius exemplaris]